jgi:hypothetical protein
VFVDSPTYVGGVQTISSILSVYPVAARKAYFCDVDDNLRKRRGDAYCNFGERGLDYNGDFRLRFSHRSPP